MTIGRRRGTVVVVNAREEARWAAIASARGDWRSRDAVIAVIGFAVPTAIGAGQRGSSRTRGATANVDGGTDRQHRHHRSRTPRPRATSPLRRSGCTSRRTSRPATSAARSKNPADAAGSITAIATTLAGPSPYIEVLDAAIARNQTYTITISAKIAVFRRRQDLQPGRLTSASRTTSTAPTTRSRVRTRPDATQRRSRLHMAFTTQPTNAASGCRHHQHRLRYLPAPRSRSRSRPQRRRGQVVQPGPSRSRRAGLDPGGGSAGRDLQHEHFGVSDRCDVQLADHRRRAGPTRSRPRPPDRRDLAPAPPRVRSSIGYCNAPWTVSRSPAACTTGTIHGNTASGPSPWTTVPARDHADAPRRADRRQDPRLRRLRLRIRRHARLRHHLRPADLNGYSKTVEMTKPTRPGGGTGSAEHWKYQICFEADYPFTSMRLLRDAQANYESLLNVSRVARCRPRPRSHRAPASSVACCRPATSESTGVSARSSARWTRRARRYPCVESRSNDDGTITNDRRQGARPPIRTGSDVSHHLS